MKMMEEKMNEPTMDRALAGEVATPDHSVKEMKGGSDRVGPGDSSMSCAVSYLNKK